MAKEYLGLDFAEYNGKLVQHTEINHEHQCTQKKEGKHENHKTSTLAFVSNINTGYL